MHLFIFSWFLLETKHFICDWLLQGPYQYKNKGTFGHPGGLLHVFIQAIGTLICFGIFYCYFGVLWHYIVTMLLFEVVTHYLMDYVKMNVNRIKGWGPTTHEQFWWWTGFDQWVHHVVYIVMVYFFL